MQNMQVDQGQYNLLRTMRERPLEELDKRLHAANKTAGRQRAFDPVSLPKPGDHLRNRLSKKPVKGPPVAVRTPLAPISHPLVHRLASFRVLGIWVETEESILLMRTKVSVCDVSCRHRVSAQG